MKLLRRLLIIFNIFCLLFCLTASVVPSYFEPTEPTINITETLPPITEPPVTEPVVTEPPTVEKYPLARTVWDFFKEELNWNDYVAAGVMGNLMVETGGQTLNLKWDLWDKASHQYYGLCQWSQKYYPEMINASLEEQLQFIKESVKPIIDTFGKNYAKGFNYEQFCQMEDIEEAALAFAKAYERCSSKSYNIRMTSALKAYEYFCAGQ